MKTYEETAESVFLRSEQLIKEQAAFRKRLLAGAAGALCLAALVTAGLWWGGRLSTPMADPTPQPPVEHEPADRHPSTTEPGFTDPPEDPAPSTEPGSVSPGTTAPDNAVWADPEGIVQWNGKQLTASLLHRLEAAPAGTVHTVAARCVAYDIQHFVWRGKTIAEYDEEEWQALQLIDQLGQLLKEGDELKYGEALCTTGAPDGTRWAKALYQERLAFYDDLLDRYIVDGAFLREQAEADLDAAQRRSAEARDAASEARAACRNETLSAAMRDFAAQGVACKLDSGLLLEVTSDELAALELTDPNAWLFCLYRAYLSEDPVQDDEGPVSDSDGAVPTGPSTDDCAELPSSTNAPPTE